MNWQRKWLRHSPDGTYRMPAKNPTPLTPEQQKLAADNVNLVFATVFRIAKQNRFIDVEEEDLIGVGMIAICRAARGYKPDMGVAFSTYAVLSIERACGNEGCTHWRARRNGSYRPPTSHTLDDLSTLMQSDAERRFVESERVRKAEEDAEIVEKTARRLYGEDADDLLAVMKGWKSGSKHSRSLGLKSGTYNCRVRDAQKKIRQTIEG